MTYAVSILRRAQKELQQLPREDYERVRDAIRALAHEPRQALRERIGNTEFHYCIPNVA